MLPFRILLLSLLLALGQVAHALHQVEHLGGPVESECQVCLHAEAAHPQPSPALPVSLFQALPILASVGLGAVVPARAPHRWFARAPPALT